MERWLPSIERTQKVVHIHRLLLVLLSIPSVYLPQITSRYLLLDQEAVEVVPLDEVHRVVHPPL